MKEKLIDLVETEYAGNAASYLVSCMFINLVRNNEIWYDETNKPEEYRKKYMKIGFVHCILENEYIDDFDMDNDFLIVLPNNKETRIVKDILTGSISNMDDADFKDFTFGVLQIMEPMVKLYFDKKICRWVVKAQFYYNINKMKKK